ncbi:conserved Plasmodium protein, unknown function [Plasmodium knowlesi strain H]|uniref:Uncharacterized protein n=3 Tax=Plasmodium knowlesi TaxID=5850 RepID=A0A5K1VDV1_PLAKH|nr:conserved Plasmodium protein, unknown function [Plasmodium knowlesi strain H]OTN65304.1 Uncharacterized protein PKNOH_S110071800 [Plasmodium knowlesi]CAA9989339.1 conserved Plasmodium protein, unknown function [Plasmodium knowlesi strain H]SBO24905.1 conserved Plasmodium protein, unknown function [Plasmodium knowlesi strain H]SBO27933.1 conserved Plasmodium protein, unknown function [Plasmodium knowlesi strain H]VVS78813.1 conserved Plasmodium protein, unknown function [Plasmodium knowlesi |eukprot:XP_002260066.1 hypothetical protein, conserved in Plasmodium species [Plasmodium knowlesi strain H]
MDPNDNKNVDPSVDSTGERQENAVASIETQDENPKKIDEEERISGVEVNENAPTTANDVVNDTKAGTTGFDTSNKDNNCSMDASIKATKQLTQNGEIREGGNGLNVEDASKLVKEGDEHVNKNETLKEWEQEAKKEAEKEAEKENEKGVQHEAVEEHQKENFPSSTVKPLEGAPMSKHPNITFSPKAPPTVMNSEPLYIEVKGLLQVLNPQDFAKNMSMESLNLAKKNENVPINKRSHSVPYKGVSKSIPKDINKQNSKSSNTAPQKFPGMPKSADLIKRPPLPIKSPIINPPITLNKSNLHKEGITGKALDTGKGKSIFRNLPKKIPSPEVVKIKPKGMIKMNFVPSKEISKDENGKVLLPKEKTSLKIPPKVLPFLIKEKSVKHKAPPKGNIKHTLHYLKRAAEIGNKEVDVSATERKEVLNGTTSNTRKSSLVTRNFIEKPKNAQKTSPLKMESVKRGKVILAKKPISKLVGESKTMGKDRKKKVLLKSIEGKEAQPSEVPLDTSAPKLDDDAGADIEKSPEKGEKSTEKGDKTNNEQINVNEDTKEEQIPPVDKEEVVVVDTEHITQREKTLEEKNESEMEKYGKDMYDLTRSETERPEEADEVEGEVVAAERVKKVDDGDEHADASGDKDLDAGKGEKKGEKEDKAEKGDGEKEEGNSADVRKEIGPKELEDGKKGDEMVQPEEEKRDETIQLAESSKPTQSESDEIKKGMEKLNEAKESKKTKSEVKKGADHKISKKVPKRGDNAPTKKDEGGSPLTMKAIGKAPLSMKTIGKASLTMKSIGKAPLSMKSIGKAPLSMKTIGKASLTMKTIGKTPITVKQSTKPELALKHKATMKGIPGLLKLKTDVTGNVKEKKGVKNEKSGDPIKSTTSKNSPPRKSTLFLKKVNTLKKATLSKNSLKDLDAEKKKLIKKLDTSMSDKNEKIDAENDSISMPSKNVSKKISSTSIKNALSIFKKKTLSKSKTDSIHELMSSEGNNKAIVSSKSENIHKVLEQKKKERENEADELFTKRLLSSKDLRAGSKSNSFDENNHQNQNPNENENESPPPMERNEEVVGSKGDEEFPRMVVKKPSLKKSKSFKKLKSKSSKKMSMSDDISIGEEKVTKKIAKLSSSRKIKSAVSQMKEEKKMKKLKSEILNKGASNLIKMKDKKGPKKYKSTTGNGNSKNVKEGMGGSKSFMEKELVKMKSFKDKWNKDFVTPRIGGMGSSNSSFAQDKSEMSEVDASGDNASHSITSPSVASKKMRKKKKMSSRADGIVSNRINGLTRTDDAPKKRGTTKKAKKIAASSSIKSMDHRIMNDLEQEAQPLPGTHKDSVTTTTSAEERRNSGEASTGMLKLRNASLLNFNRIKSANTLRNLSVQVKLESPPPPMEEASQGEPNLKVNNLCSKTPAVGRRSSGMITQNTSWMFGKCCSVGNSSSEYVYERKEPAIQNFSSLFNVNNKYMPVSTNLQMALLSGNSVKLSNVYESDLLGRGAWALNRETLRGSLKGNTASVGGPLRRPVSGLMSRPSSRPMGRFMSKPPSRPMSSQVNGQMGNHMSSTLSYQLDDQMASQMSGQMNGQMSGQMNGQMSGQMSGQWSSQLSHQLDGRNSLPLSCKMNSGSYSNKSLLNNSSSLELRRRPSCNTTVNYCSCI